MVIKRNVLSLPDHEPPVRLQRLRRLTRLALAGWWNDNVPRLGASLSYYTLFSLAPILIIAIAIAGAVFGGDAVRGRVAEQLNGLMGPVGALAVQSIIENAASPRAGMLASVLGIVAFFLGATGCFLELEAALNDIWKVKSKTSALGFRGMLIERFVSFGLVVAVGFLLLVSLVMSALLAGLGSYLDDRMPGLSMLWTAINLIVSLGVSLLLFAMVYKVLPNVPLRWRDVWSGALITAVLFSVGKLLIGLYLGRSGVGSAYGAAGSIVVLLVWVYYTAQVVLLGAEFTKVYAAPYHVSTPSLES